MNIPDGFQMLAEEPLKEPGYRPAKDGAAWTVRLSAPLRKRLNRVSAQLRRSGVNIPPSTLACACISRGLSTIDPGNPFTLLTQVTVTVHEQGAAPMMPEYHAAALQDLYRAIAEGSGDLGLALAAAAKALGKEG
jgi:hypothetical protein